MFVNLIEIDERAYYHPFTNTLLQKHQQEHAVLQTQFSRLCALHICQTFIAQQHTNLIGWGSASIIFSSISLINDENVNCSF